MTEPVSGADEAPGTSPRMVAWGLWAPCVSGEAHWHVSDEQLPIPVWTHTSEHQPEEVFFDPVDVLGEYYGEHYCADEYTLPDGWVSSWELDPHAWWTPYDVKAVPEGLAEEVLGVYKQLSGSALFREFANAATEHMYLNDSMNYGDDEDYDITLMALRKAETKLVRLQHESWLKARQQLRRKLRTRAGNDLLTWMESRWQS